MTTAAAAPGPDRAGRHVAVLVLDNPPLNLFAAATFDALEARDADLTDLTDPARPDRARAVLVRAEGKVVSGGGDVTVLVGYAVHNEPHVSASLHTSPDHAARREQPGQPIVHGGGTPFSGLNAVRLRWPSSRRPPGGSLHAKLLVIDDREALVGSANVTGAALCENLECGLLVRSGVAPRQLRDHVLRLREAGHLVPAD